MSQINHLWVLCRQGKTNDMLDEPAWGLNPQPLPYKVDIHLAGLGHGVVAASVAMKWKLV